MSDTPNTMTEENTSQEKTSEKIENDKGSARAHNPFRLGFLIHDVSRMRKTVFDQVMKPKGITRSQWWVLANLSRHEGENVMSTELAKMLDVGKVTLGGLIERLEVAGYVYRRPSKKDRRAKIIFITESGHRLIKEMRAISEDLNRQFSVDLSQEEIEETERHLLTLKHTLRKLVTANSENE